MLLVQQNEPLELSYVYGFACILMLTLRTMFVASNLVAGVFASYDRFPS